jgi:hypothetical protein
MYRRKNKKIKAEVETNFVGKRIEQINEASGSQRPLKPWLPDNENESLFRLN